MCELCTAAPGYSGLTNSAAGGTIAYHYLQMKSHLPFCKASRKSSPENCSFLSLATQLDLSILKPESLSTSFISLEAQLEQHWSVSPMSSLMDSVFKCLQLLKMVSTLFFSPSTSFFTAASRLALIKLIESDIFTSVNSILQFLFINCLLRFNPKTFCVP